MDFLEKTLEDIIFNTPNYLLNIRGLPIYGIKKRQIKVGNYGIIDLITFKREDGIFNINLFELKRGEISCSTFWQSVRYKKGIINYMDSIGFSFPFRINIILIGSSVSTDGEFAFLPEILNIKFYKYNYEFDGVHFEPIKDYKLTDEGFDKFITKKNKNIWLKDSLQQSCGQKIGS